MLSVPRNTRGEAAFPVSSHLKPGQLLRATDARIIGELKSKYVLATDLESVTAASAKENLIITTPNADYLPQINLGTQSITFYHDGRWGAEDWAQWPQWYFIGQEHFAYVLRKPSTDQLPSHPLRRLWWNMELEHFVDRGSNIGILKKSIAEELYEIRQQIQTEVDMCRCHEGAVYQKLQAAAANMRSCTSALLYTPQKFLNVMMTVTAAQRYCLTTKAIVDKINKWDALVTSGNIQPVDNTIMGCVTGHLTSAIEFYEKGVPVWLVRPVGDLPEDIVILEQQYPVMPREAGVVLKPWKGAPVLYRGPHSREIHATIESWKPTTLDIRLIEQHPGDEGERVSRTDRAGKRAENRGRPYSKPPAREASFSKAPVRVSINDTLFDKPVSPSLYSSQPLPVWSAALQCVEQDTRRIIEHQGFRVFRGYAFPPPHVLCVSNEQNSLNAVLAFLAVRKLWLEKLSHETQTILPNPQQWRTKLRDIALELELSTQLDKRTSSLLSPSQKSQSQSKATSPTTSSPQLSSLVPSSSAPSKTSRSQTSRQAAADIFTIQIPQKGELLQIFWYDRSVWTRDRFDLPRYHRQLVTWYCQEHNFRLELVQLDRTVLPDIWGTAHGTADRNAKLDALWPNNFLLMHDVPVSSAGISALYSIDRREYLEAFRVLLLAYPGEAPRYLATLVTHKNNPITGRKEWNQSLLNEVEAAAAKFYCQTFFDYFGRAPSVPHIRPSP
ncbi:hypothetical protein NP233_g11662 [Leucocoprinus birnbaumii]|uniref:Uncharacterized protein n=1 Tax=Leucocoprinus birnbaumii TaxID=56174 RepID=A0AAD5VG13_9AGAR|nr:hypothetical protein NP233_g11662 [Leucocoprinus birnbaumii]